MSHDLDILEEIALSTRLSIKAGIYSGPGARAHMMPTEACRNGHIRTEQNTRWSKSPGRRRQRVCLDCKRALELMRP